MAVSIWFAFVGLSSIKMFAAQLQEIRKTNMARFACDNAEGIKFIQPHALLNVGHGYVAFIKVLFCYCFVLTYFFIILLFMLVTAYSLIKSII